MFLIASGAFAHGSHCHKKNEDGSLSDFPGAATRKACVAQGGVWLHHHPHCHQKGDTHADLPNLKTRKECLAEGGVWSDHAHQSYAR
jgi:hypothetical protein